jgi:NADH-quinone oxidoreductase subunit G
VNRDGRVQRYIQAKAAPGMARPAWWVAAEAWGIRHPGSGVPSSAAEAFAGLGEFIPALDGLSYHDLGLTGRVLPTRPPAALPVSR